MVSVTKVESDDIRLGCGHLLTNDGVLPYLTHSLQTDLAYWIQELPTYRVELTSPCLCLFQPKSRPTFAIPLSSIPKPELVYVKLRWTIYNPTPNSYTTKIKESLNALSPDTIGNSLRDLVSQ